MAYKTLAIAALAATTLVGAAYADQPVPSTPYTNTWKWYIAMDPNQGGGCYAEAHYSQINTALRFGYNPVTHWTYVTIRSPNWSFSVGQTYTLSVSLNDSVTQSWTGVVSPMSDGSVSLYFGALQRGALGLIAAASVIDFRYQGQYVFRGTLLDSAQAVTQLNQCELAYGVQIDPFGSSPRPTAPAVRRDPFRGV